MNFKDKFDNCVSGIPVTWIIDIVKLVAKRIYIIKLFWSDMYGYQNAKII